jgi:hypothetical protein
MGRVIRGSTVMTNVSDHIRFQAEHHPIESQENFSR